MTGWLDKRGLAHHLACSTRTIELAVNEGMPHAVIFGRLKFRADEVEAWLEHTGHLERRGATIVCGEHNGPPTPRTPTGPDTRRLDPHVHPQA